MVVLVSRGDSEAPLDVAAAGSGLAQESNTYAKGVVPKGFPGLLDGRGTDDRYQPRRCIGTGSAGAVYEAFDRERGHAVALKTLRHFSPAALYQLKQEFRTLADVQHPNLVRLYELVVTDSRDIFFTMELVEGTDFLEHVRGAGAEHLDRLRRALRQLTLGVHALHAAGKVHRDIKPSNVIVTPEGRVVLLDFGVATELVDRAPESARDEQPIVGTALYMAPEQAIGASITAASDWYAVGVILYEALVGSAPFTGSVPDVLRMKTTLEAPATALGAHDVPADLDTLCTALLQRAPELRPSGPEIMRTLGMPLRQSMPIPALRATGEPTKYVGRRPQLAALRSAFDATRDGRSIAVRVVGASGMGKSALIQHFLDEVLALGDAVVLRGRAYERESVPYKAIDSWMDALSRHLLTLSERGSTLWLPKDVWALTRLFPVLRRVPEVRDVRDEPIADVHVVRRRAVAALRELLASLSRQGPIILYIDDSQWGDADSAALLLDLLRPPQAPPLLLILTHREEEAQRSPFLIATREHWPDGAEARELEVGPLDADEARQLALELLGSDDEPSRVAAQAVEREAHGSPFLLEELVRSHQGAKGREGIPLAISLEDLVAERFAQLPEGPRLLLEIVSVSGRPLPVSIVANAAGVSDHAHEVVALLRTRRFVREGLRNGKETVETCHDRIREVIVARLSPETVRDYHGRLANAFEQMPAPDPEAVAIHLVGAAEIGRAAPYAERAAEQAIDKLAFDRAVDLLRIALRGTPSASEKASPLRKRLAEALSLAGRGAEAGRAFLDASELASGLPRVELERRAAQQLLGAGRIDEGAALLRRVLQATGMRAPRSALSAVFWLLLYRLFGRLIGLRHQERKAEAVTHEHRVQIETTYSVVIGFAIVDVLLGACMQARHLILALCWGDGQQILRAAILEAEQLASLGGPQSTRERDLIRIAERLAAESESAEAEAFFDASLGVNSFLRGRWKEASARLDASTTKLPRGHAQWQANAHLFGVRSLYFSGDLKELAWRQARIDADARDRGDLYTTVNFATTTAIATSLAADDPERARSQVREAMARWSQTGFFVQHWQAMVFEPDIDLYAGDGPGAYERLMRDRQALKRSPLLNVQFVRALTDYAHGRCAVASLRPGVPRARIVEARRAVRRLERERLPWTVPLAATVRAGVENAEGHRAEAIAVLGVAIESAEAADMSLHAAAARYRLGQLLGGETGRDLVRRASQAMAAQDIRNAASWVGVNFPGNWVTNE